ncbi:lipid II:glycine glycyltransferase FemX [Aestuariimicrobium ganziense]|uniref:lipid II:glycine glycyltransferase FemX n=1 Tax=Aestuariimicrobium ganziense TaxID=2773677 RepID=UPI0019448F53|nr:peptidoglycan bridge formation glycyltransferase FemA/FemB family protein [Aestuariimicrobium ganziense]
MAVTSVRRITPAEHLAFLEKAAAPGSDFPATVSFLQTPAWGRAKPEWRSESLGFFDGSSLVGVGLVLYRQLPKVKRYLAYLPEGPVLDWTSAHVGDHLRDLAAHVKAQGAFGLRIGPTLVHRRWKADTIKAAIADDAITQLSQATPDAADPRATRLETLLKAGGWHPTGGAEGFAAGQPKFNFRLPLTNESGEQLSEDALLKGMNQLWRRNIKKADKSGVEVSRGSRDDLAAFHAAYLETAERDRFTPRPLGYFETMWDALNDELDDRMRVYLAHHEGDLVAATTWIRVGRHAWYSYGASTNAKREVRGSNAVQWQMMRDSLEAGAEVYDLRGIVEGVGVDDPELGLIQFKVGTGGEAVSYVGEWDLPINKLLHKAFETYLARRSR